MMGPPPPPAMDATMEATMEAAAATERFRRLFVTCENKFSQVWYSSRLSVCLSVC